MSDRKKKEIHVKDLVIKAENVIFEQPKRRPVDPFFGPRRPVAGTEDEVKSEVDFEVDEESSSSSSSDEDDDHKRRRPPFSWI
ncbi:hypothetical protein HNQ94_001517 [Salirhabdus euzebyi]|uniref:Uncharacterized protein n=1 Tax=Salirhabdus euzebyi TaxID=394506 RepID=A0A841Q3T5_9BACI|nr:hypothetical protein [Salirhabdus euzebyi]MBB6453069.1 hypothetical protein [Salirhabdus euzebyi]